jgi:mannose-6-phosphate isomerase-like protein (cupin superfamily)
VNAVIDKIVLSEKYGKLPAGDYAQGIIAKMNDYEIKVVRFKGEFVWHSHSDTDETFIVVDGVLTMNFRDHVVQVHPGELIVVPRGVEHKPSSVEGYKSLLIEPENVPNTGGVASDLKVSKVDWV